MGDACEFARCEQELEQLGCPRNSCKPCTSEPAARLDLEASLLLVSLAIEPLSYFATLLFRYCETIDLRVLVGFAGLQNCAREIRVVD
jgi:hypothetical protein